MNKIIDNLIALGISQKYIDDLRDKLRDDDDLTKSYHLSTIPYEEWSTGIDWSKGLYTRVTDKLNVSGRYGNMVDRCYRPNNEKYPNYGKRGILMCDAWHRLNPEGRGNFIQWIESQIEEGVDVSELQIDRRDNDKGYSPHNCRMVTGAINCQNRTTTRLFDHQVTYLREWLGSIEDPIERRNAMVSWAEEEGIHYYTVKQAVIGLTWHTLDSVVKPIQLPDLSKKIDDEVVIGLRNKYRPMNAVQRKEAAIEDASDYGIAASHLYNVLNGNSFTHLNDICQPLTRKTALKSITAEELALEYLKVKDTMTKNKFVTDYGNKVGSSRTNILHHLKRGLRLLATNKYDIAEALS